LRLYERFVDILYTSRDVPFLSYPFIPVRCYYSLTLHQSKHSCISFYSGMYLFPISRLLRTLFIYFHNPLSAKSLVHP
jgi:hypothetical protein